MSGDNCKMRLERNLVPSLSATAVVSWMFPCIKSEVLYPNLGVCILSTHSKACLSSSEELPLQDMRQNQLKDINQNVARRLSISDRSGKASSSIGVTWKTTKKKVQSKETTSSLNIRMIVLFLSNPKFEWIPHCSPRTTAQVRLQLSPELAVPQSLQKGRFVQQNDTWHHFLPSS